MKHLQRNICIIMASIIAIFFSNSSYAIENTQPQIKKQRLFSVKKTPSNTKLKPKKVTVTEINLPKVTSMRRLPENFSVMSIDDCVNYTIEHNPNLLVAKKRINAAKAGIGESRASYAPRLSARVNYGYNNTVSRVNTSNSSIGFNVGISEMIWDFGRTTAKINMAKYNTESAQFDYDYELLNVIYDIKIKYYKVLSALANLDIYEQNVRINTLNFERTKAMFDEGLKSKIDVVNAEVNLTDAKIQLVEGQKNLANSILDLKTAMYYTESQEFVVKNTENFGFLKADYKKKVENLDDNNLKLTNNTYKKNEDGLLMLTSGIEHRDIIQNFKFAPYNITKQEAVDKAMELRPDLKSDRMLAKVQEESLKAIKRQYAPEITGEVTWGYTRNEGYNNSPLGVGASIGLGTINPYSIHYQVKSGEAYLDIARHNINIDKTNIFWDVQSNYIDMRQLERKIPLMNSKVKATLENFELADGRYSVGLNNYVELQDALTNYNKSQLNFVEAVFQYNVARETLLKSMGVK